MKPLPHRYRVQLAGGPSGHATLAVAGAPELRSAPPEEFGGPGDAWSPEHLLLAAVQTCFLFTLRSVAQASKIEFHSLELAAEGTVDRQDGVTRFTQITLRPRITLAPGTDRGRTLRVLEKSEKACLVSASLATPISLEPEILPEG
jgi:peroxiredoxin-like protein